MWAYSPQNRENGIFGINLCLTKNSGGPQKTLNIGAQLQNFLCAMTFFIIVLKIIPLHSVSVIIKFVIPKRDKKQTKKKHHTFSSTAGARHTTPPCILGMTMEEVRAIFAPHNFFDTISCFAGRGY